MPHLLLATGTAQYAERKGIACMLKNAVFTIGHGSFLNRDFPSASRNDFLYTRPFNPSGHSQSKEPFRN